MFETKYITTDATTGRMVMRKFQTFGKQDHGNKHAKLRAEKGGRTVHTVTTIIGESQTSFPRVVGVWIDPKWKPARREYMRRMRAMLDAEKRQSVLF